LRNGIRKSCPEDTKDAKGVVEFVTMEELSTIDEQATMAYLVAV
jgi:hypothetical protein